MGALIPTVTVTSPYPGVVSFNGFTGTEFIGQRNEDTRNLAKVGGATRPRRREAVLPNWNSAPLDFGFFIGRLETRIEAVSAPYWDDQKTCLDVGEIRPDIAKPRVVPWFDKRKYDGRFAWRELILHP